MKINENDEALSPQDPIRKRRGLTLSQYVQRRNGVPMGAPGSLKNMLQRSFGAGTFAGFWQYWNPIWGYGLGKYVFAPLQRGLPAWLALILTFSVSGLLHDLVIMLIRRSLAFIFVPWFFLLSIGVVLGTALKLDFSSQPWGVRAGINLTYLVAGFVAMQYAKQFLGIP